MPKRSVNKHGESFRALVVKQLEGVHWVNISKIQAANGNCSIADACRVAFRIAAEHLAGK